MLTVNSKSALFCFLRLLCYIKLLSPLVLHPNLATGVMQNGKRKSTKAGVTQVYHYIVVALSSNFVKPFTISLAPFLR